jgi:hypothetical protein
VFRTLRRITVALLRATEAAALSLGRRPWKIDRFNRLIRPDVISAVRNIGTARTVVGIPFHKETANIAALVANTQRDLESRLEEAGIVIVGEQKTRSALLDIPLPASSARVKVVTFFKPFGFGQRPGLARRSWSHWAILQVANGLGADVVFIDADVRNSQGWVNRYLDAIQQRGADLAVANYVRRFDDDDAMVHIWDRLIFGAVFREWIAFRHGGDYAISRKLVPRILNDVSILRERAYTMDSAVMAYAARRGGRIESVWLGAKEHEPITLPSLFNRLQTLVHSVFDDVDTHLSSLRWPSIRRTAVLQRTRKAASVPPPPAAGASSRMRDLVGSELRAELHADMGRRFRAAEGDIRRALGAAAFERFAALASFTSAEEVSLSPRPWAKATIRFLTRYVRTRDRDRKSRLARACVPILQAGILGFVNATYDLSYTDAFEHLDAEYLPAFEQTWDSLSRRLWPYRLVLARRVAYRTAFRFGAEIRRLL